MTTRSIRIITSAAYVEQELAAEFGQIPPSFLSIGVSPLYEAQIKYLGLGDPIYLTIPEGFSPRRYDQERLQELGVVLVPVPEGLKLGESIVYAINFITSTSVSVQLLHGDTLIEDLPIGLDDLIAIHDEGDEYSWSAVDLRDGVVAELGSNMASSGHPGNRPVACGYFVFSNSTLLVRAITQARGSFIAGLNLYIRDHATRGVRVARWYDFGHIQTYFRSRRAITTERAFNSLKISRCSVHKSSTDHSKIIAEATWFASVPPAVAPYTARLLEVGQSEGTVFYRTEYRYAPTLAELFVFSSIGRLTWYKILRSCEEFLNACTAHKGPSLAGVALTALAIDKTIARLERYSSESGFDIDKPTSFDGRSLPSLRRVAESATREIDLRSGCSETLMHGDFCFSNILYDSRADRITVIDPRGHVSAGTASAFGDVTYDLAKLSHSISGQYDHILAGRYALRLEGSHGFTIGFEASEHHRWLQHALSDLKVDGVGAGNRSVRAVTVSLFLSMLPLHADRPDRQAAFIANALRLYIDLERSKP